VCLRAKSIQCLCLNFEPIDRQSVSLKQLRIRKNSLVTPWDVVSSHIRRTYAGKHDYPIYIRITNPQHLGHKPLEEAEFDLLDLRRNVSRAFLQLRAEDRSFVREDYVDVVVHGYGNPVGYVRMNSTCNCQAIPPISKKSLDQITVDYTET
jgi:hypothetical protein